MTTLRTTVLMKTDISGSTPRLRALGERDLTTLLAEHRDLLSRVGAAHEGRIVKPEGDGFWLVFPSVTAAALAAMSMQEELRLAQPNAGDARLSMRIVITLGDVLHADGGLVGDAVVLATRIEAVTPPDQIYVAATAWHSMNHAEISSAFVDSFALKGFTEPVSVYRIEQTHRTRIVTDSYLVFTDLRRFTAFTETSSIASVETILDRLFELVNHVCREFHGTNRFNVGDGYCLTFSEAGQALGATQRLAEEWIAFGGHQHPHCPMTIAAHKGVLRAFRSYLYSRDLNVVAQMVSVTDGADTSVFVSEAVRADVAGTSWEARLEPVTLSPTPGSVRSERTLAGIAIYRLRLP